jgi:hypothetical protein
MMKLTLNARIELALATALLLGSCDGPAFNEKERDEILDIASDEAVDPDEFANLQRRVEEIESRLDLGARDE